MPAADAGLLTRALRGTGRFLLRVQFVLALILAGSWAVLIFDLSSQARPVQRGPSPLWELLSNLAHAPLFGILTLLVAAVVLRERDGSWPRPRGARIALVLAITLAYGILDELHQSRVPNRDASALDVLTDSVGGALVLWIVFALGRAGLRERELVARLALGLLLCLASAALATVA
ncbi:MAG: hypothetical protein EXS08_02575 [Planctomycetes bacterium]|nr:hypothetical protein [Planctomycetota bacterium]